jgi:4-hydroxy-3-methylbut-2-enyl diphosphate reductase
MIVTIDPGAGFCFGVEKAIQMAEKNAKKKQKIFCHGEIVHNEEENKRLNKLGVHFIDKVSLNTLKNETLLIRAHGEPPETYQKAASQNVEIVDASCPIVLKLQEKIKNTWIDMQALDGQVAIVGKQNHPEIIGLNGQTGNNALILEKLADIENINFNRPLRLFAQTTIDTAFYQEIISSLEKRMLAEFTFHNSICRHVSNRKPALIEFCKNNDLIIFVSGMNSSNGKALFELCKSVNDHSYKISSDKEFDKNWITHVKSIGISGATSTPLWLMEKIKQKILSFNT